MSTFNTFRGNSPTSLTLVKDVVGLSASFPGGSLAIENTGATNSVYVTEVAIGSNKGWEVKPGKSFAADFHTFNDVKIVSSVATTIQVAVIREVE